MDWIKRGACTHQDPELFFPIGTTGPAVRQTQEAKRVCLGCDVRSPCLDWALGNERLEGVWAATTEEERRGLRRSRISAVG
jgi:WhiB family redox-sensing transcriptional regulator